MGVLKFLLAVVLLALLEGAVVSKLWLWFLVPLGVHAITVAHAFGLGCLVNVWTFRSDLATKDKPIGERVLSNVILILVMFGMGYVAHKCM